MLLNEERRAEALAELEARETERNRQRAIAEQARRKDAATGIFLCLLDLQEAVPSAEAARVRLNMCETNEERRQVSQRIHA